MKFFRRFAAPILTALILPAALSIFALCTAAVMSPLAAGEPSVPESPLLYTGHLNYAKPSSFGFLGYSNPKQPAPIPPSLDDQKKSGVSGTVPATEPLLKITQTNAETSLVSEIGAPTYGQPEGETVVYDPGANFSVISPDDRVGLFLLEPRPTRESLFQGVAASMGYLPNTGNRKSGMTQLDGSATIGLPFPDTDHPLLLTPDIQWTDLSFPDAWRSVTGEKAGLYSVGGEIRSLAPLTEQLMFDLAVGLHWNSDFHSSDSKSLRITGRGCAVIQTGETSRLIFGAAYSDLSDWPVVPIAGILLKPSDDILLDLYFPRPKIAKRLTCCKDPNGGNPYWIYLAGELDRNRWTFRPKDSSGQNDYELTSSDWRIFGGIERRVADEIGWAVEGGLVFGRDLEIQPLHTGNGGGLTNEIHPETTGVVRLKIMY